MRDGFFSIQWVALQMVEEDRERVKGLKEDLLEEAQRELIRVQ